MTENLRPKSVLLTTEIIRAKRRYFNALRSLWRLYDEYGYKLTGIHRDMERTALNRLRQAFAAMARHLGANARAGRLVYAIVDYEKKNAFIRAYGEERKAWSKPYDWSNAPPEWRAVHEMVEALKKSFDELKVDVSAMRECQKDVP